MPGNYFDPRLIGLLYAFTGTKENKNCDWTKMLLIICYCGFNYWPDSSVTEQFKSAMSGSHSYEQCVGSWSMRGESLKCRVIAQPSGLSKNKPPVRDLLIWAIEYIL